MALGNSIRLGIREKLILCQMALDGVEGSTIEFYKKTCVLLRHGALSSELAEAAYICPNAARRHLNRMKNKGYVRLEQKIWRQAGTIMVLRDPDLVQLWGAA